MMINSTPFDGYLANFFPSTANPRGGLTTLWDYRIIATYLKQLLLVGF